MELGEDEKAAALELQQTIWQRIALGLHVHRYFLHVAPILEDAEAVDALSAPELVSGYGRARAHLGLRRLEKSIMASQLLPVMPAGLAIVSMAHGVTQLPQMELTTSFLEIADERTALRVQEAWRLVEGSAFGSILHTALDGVVVCKAGTVGNTLACLNRAAVRFAFMPYSPSKTLLELSDHLVAACAVVYFVLFWFEAQGELEALNDPTKDPPVLNVASKSPDCWILGNGLVDAWRLHWLKTEALQLPGDEYRAAQVNRLEHRLQAFGPAFANACASVTSIPLSELLTTSFPSPQRFSRFESGGGPGQ